jgi:DisA bacterial checkpoint controller nucleotide-binding
VPTHRIWQHQDDFAHAYRDTLKGVLELLAVDVTPILFLVGVDLEKGTTTVSPKNQAPLKSHDFADKFDCLVTSRVFIPDDALPAEAWRGAYKPYEEYLLACQQEIKSSVEELYDPEPVLVLASPACEVNNHAICAIALLIREQYQRYAHLDDDLYQKRGRWPSLIWAAVDAVLDDASAELQKRNAGAMLEWKHSDERELLRTAATHFVRRHAWAGSRLDPVDVMAHGVYELFDAASVISSTRYEQREGVGDLIIADAGHRAIDIDIQFDPKVPIIEHRRVRKVLQMCTKDTHVLSNGRYIYGLGTFDRNRYDETKNDAFVVKFVKHHCWELWHLDTALIRVEYGQAGLPKRPYEPANVDTALRRTFPSMVAAQRTRVLKVVEDAADAAHGTMVVISKSAATEGPRLAAGGGTIKPFAPTARKIKAVSAIDGAILLDLDAVCHGIGLILDGKAEAGGDASRGARYNSAIRYLSQQSDCVILVVSEDRTIDILDPSSIEAAHAPETKPTGRRRSRKKVKKRSTRSSSRRSP